jgi:hypothetical protein
MFLHERLSAPVQFHFGETDASIPLEAVQKHARRLPEQEIFTCPAGHAFNRDIDPAHFHGRQRRLALDRTLAFFTPGNLLAAIRHERLHPRSARWPPTTHQHPSATCR